MTTLEEWNAILGGYGKDALFRGQVKNYESEGNPSITTSFKRKGCHPPLMQKWTHYCSEILASLLGPDEKDLPGIEFTQALLQHYGFRSFYIDVTSDVSVAAWFSCNVYSSERKIYIEEDCNEDGLFRVFDSAQYHPAEEDGYVYVISRDAMLAKDIEIVDLDAIKSDEFPARYMRQKGLLVGPGDGIPHEAIVEVLKVSPSVLRQISAGHSMTILFPPPSEDYIYRLLLSVPHHMVRNPNGDGFDIGMSAFVRGINIPEYEAAHKKIHGEEVAFYQGAVVGQAPGVLADVIVQGPDDLLYHTTIEEPNDIGNLLFLLKDHKKLLVETAGLLRLPPFYKTIVYLKGAHLELVGDSLVKVSGLSVKHPGLSISKSQIDEGWTYRVEAGILERSPAVGDCPCNYSRRHELILTILKKVNIYLKKNVMKYDGVVYRMG